MNNDSGVIDKVPLSCIATLLFSDAIAQPASTGCSSRVWVLPTSILQRKISRCIYVCIACYNCVGSQDASKTWKAFCKSNRPFSSSTWSGRLFSARKIFHICNRRKQGEPVPPRNFWIRFYKSDFKSTCWTSPKPDIPHKIALATRFRWYRISKFSWIKICSMKIGVDSFNIASNRSYLFRFWR